MRLNRLVTITLVLFLILPAILSESADNITENIGNASVSQQPAEYKENEGTEIKTTIAENESIEKAEEIVESRTAEIKNDTETEKTRRMQRILVKEMFKADNRSKERRNILLQNIPKKEAKEEEKSEETEKEKKRSLEIPEIKKPELITKKNVFEEVFKLKEEKKEEAKMQVEEVKEKLKVELDKEEKNMVKKWINESNKEIEDIKNEIRKFEAMKKELREKIETKPSEIRVQAMAEQKTAEQPKEEAKEDENEEEPTPVVEAEKPEEKEEVKDEKEASKNETEVKEGLEEAEQLEQDSINKEIRVGFLEEIENISVEGETKEEQKPELEAEKPEEKEPELVMNTTINEEDVEPILKDIAKKEMIKENINKALNDLKEEKITIEQINKELEILEERSYDLTSIKDKVKDNKKKYEETAKNIKIEKTANFHEVKDEKTDKYENITVITLSIKPTKILFNLSVYEEIPKEIASDASEVIFYDSDYKVIEPDPLIVWTFATVSSDIGISYGVKKKVDFKLLEEAETVPIAEKIIEKDEYSLFKIAFPAFMTILIVFTVIFLHKFGSAKEISRGYKEKDILNTSLGKLMLYIEKKTAQGIEEKHIRYYLLKKGLPKSLINEAFNRIKTV